MAGFSQDDIQSEFNHIKDVANEYKGMTDEEKKANTTSLDDIKKMLDDENSNEIS